MRVIPRLKDCRVPTCTEQRATMRSFRPRFPTTMRLAPVLLATGLAAAGPAMADRTFDFTFAGQAVAQQQAGGPGTGVFSGTAEVRIADGGDGRFVGQARAKGEFKGIPSDAAARFPPSGDGEAIVIVSGGRISGITALLKHEAAYGSRLAISGLTIYYMNYLGPYSNVAALARLVPAGAPPSDL